MNFAGHVRHDSVDTLKGCNHIPSTHTPNPPPPTRRKAILFDQKRCTNIPSTLWSIALRRFSVLNMSAHAHHTCRNMRESWHTFKFCVLPMSSSSHCFASYRYVLTGMKGAAEASHAVGDTMACVTETTPLPGFAPAKPAVFASVYPQDQSDFTSLADISVMDGQKAMDSMQIIDRAIEEVAANRGRMGAFQKNTLESNLNFLRIAHENVLSSESVIRDADMATEMANFTRNQILMDSSVAMLAQANQAPMAMLQLLQ